MSARSISGASVRPDLVNPYLPDMADLDASVSSIPIEQGGMSVRARPAGDVDWPESGPSSQPMQIGNQPKVGPFGSKVIAAMTGAIVTSLLSKLSKSA